jgi:hypothetical protein
MCPAGQECICSLSENLLTYSNDDQYAPILRPGIVSHGVAGLHFCLLPGADGDMSQ